MVNIINRQHFVEKVRQKLLAADDDGIMQNKLYQQVRTPNWNINELVDLLMRWESQSMVQSFKVTPLGAKRPGTLWRATIKLRDEWTSTEI